MKRHERRQAAKSVVTSVQNSEKHFLIFREGGKIKYKFSHPSDAVELIAKALILDPNLNDSVQKHIKALKEGVKNKLSK